MEHSIEIPVKSITESETASLAVIGVANALGISPEEAILKICQFVGKETKQKEHHGN